MAPFQKMSKQLVTTVTQLVDLTQNNLEGIRYLSAAEAKKLQF